MPSSIPLGMIYINGVDINLLCLLYGFPTTSESGQAEARYPASFCVVTKHYKFVRVWVFDGQKKYKIMNLEDFLVNFADLFDDTDVSEIKADTEFQELEEWSSLTAMGIIALAKIQFGKAITGHEVRRCKTVEELYNFIVSK